MSRMSELDIQLQRLAELDIAVRHYLSHLAAFEQGNDYDGPHMEYWRRQMDELTSDELFNYLEEVA